MGEDKGGGQQVALNVEPQPQREPLIGVFWGKDICGRKYIYSMVFPLMPCTMHVRGLALCMAYCQFDNISVSAHIAQPRLHHGGGHCANTESGLTG